MIHAYDEIYLESARNILANMFDYGVHGLDYTLQELYDHFLATEYCAKFQKGDYTVLTGRSGIELALDIMDAWPESPVLLIERCAYDRSPEYWLGWSLAYYQWWTGLEFSKITYDISIEEIRSLYYPYHEMDIRQFVDKMDELRFAFRREARLKKYRTLIGLSQKELAEKADIPIRTIQQYEQCQKNINKAQMEYLIRLSKVLHCCPEDLMEKR